MQTIAHRPLDGVGVEITDIDLASDLDTETFDQLKRLMNEHGLIIYRNQSLTEEQHIAFAEKWGEININRFFAAHPDYPQIAMVAKGKKDQDNIGGGWHTDHSYDLEPAMGSILVARELPESGGDTLFASMYAAYDALSEKDKELIAPLRARHSTHHIFGSSQSAYSQSDTEERVGNSASADAMKDVFHPIALAHPESGKTSLYVNPAFTVGIEGIGNEESQALLQRLYAHAMKPEFVFRLEWAPGTIAMWDNRSTWHFALNDYHGQSRVMHRITIEGCAFAGSSIAA